MQNVYLLHRELPGWMNDVREFTGFSKLPAIFNPYGVART